MPDDKQKVIRIFIGSPSDVVVERDIVFKVVTDVYETFRNIVDGHKILLYSKVKDSYLPIPILRVARWEDVPPNAGIPSEIILEQFPVDESDIFVFILWKRFGTPTGTRRIDGTRYTSGTQEEYERAYSCYIQNKSKRPVIMVYRKNDDFSSTSLSTKDLVQYRRVRKFFDELETPRGKRPALIYLFKGNEFEGVFRRHLFTTVLSLLGKDENEEDGKTEANAQKETLALEQPNGDSSDLDKWLADNNFRDNPFKYNQAEHEENLAKYFVPFKGFSLISNEILQGKKNWLFFGVEGSGKTALKQFVLSRCAPSRTSKTLAISYETNDFLEAATQSTDADGVLLYVSQQIFNFALARMDGQVRYSLEVRKFTEPALIFQRLGKILKEQGYEQALSLLDLAPGISDNNLSRLIVVFSRLVSLSSDRMGFRLFLPKSLQTRFLHQDKYLGKCELREIRWEDEDLKELIKRRLIYYSTSQVGPNKSLAPLCEPKGDLRSIDDTIVKHSEGNPRAVIWLANRLFLEHCQTIPVHLKIQPPTWEKVQLHWGTTGRNLIRGSSGKTETFSSSGTEVYFRNNDKPLKLSKRSKFLLKPLVEADGQTCSKEELIRSAWPGVNSDGVTASALREAMRRLKVELEKKNDIDPAWIKTAHGQGYQLLEPEGNIAIGGNATNSVIVTGDHNRINLRVNRRSDKEDA